ncbi:MAG: class I SAM-dependent methyltransferase [Nannocystaceae bacterium]|nr:class I SAM-dependent methyltransferase [Nannocystaceae bacterium]
MDEPASSNARKHESRNPLQRALIAHFTAVLCREVAALRPRRVLELGCGEGYMLDALARAGIGAELVGVELDAGAVAHARARLGPRATIHHADVRALDPALRADCVLVLEVLEHLEQPAALLPAIAARCAPWLVASVPWEPLFRGLNLLRGRHLSRWGNHPEHHQTWSRRGFVSLLQQHFEVVRTPLVPPWTMVVARTAT